MAYTKRTWLGRQGTGLNKFSIGGASPVTIVNQPDSVTQVGDALSAGNLNDLEDRIEDAFDDVDTALDTKADEQDVTNLNNAITAIDHRVQNLEQAKGDYVVQSYKDGSITPSGKGNWAVVEGLRGVSRVENNLSDIADGSSGTGNTIGTHFTTFQYNHFYLFALRATFPSQPTSGGGSASPSTPIYLGFWNNALTSFQRHPFAYQSSGNYAFVGSGASLDGNLTDGTSAKIVLQTSPNTGELCTFADVLITDLNIYFGTSDLSFLGATDSAKLATIQSDYPHLLTPSDYGVRIVDSSYSGVRAEGVNIWDEEWEVGAFDSQGEKKTGTYIISKNLIPVLPNTTYYSKSPASMWVREYDSEGVYLGIYESGLNTSFTTSARTHYISLELYGNAPYTTYNHDIQICLNSYADKTTYHPYMESTLSLTFQGKSAGSVYDSCEPNVEVGGVAKKRETTRVGVYNVTGNEGWYIIGSGTESRAVIAKPSLWGFGNGLSNNFIYGDALNVGEFDITAGYVRINVYGKATTDAEVATWLQNHPTVIYYPLATESVTLSDPLIDNTLLTESGGRMATVQTGTVVDGSFDMGFINL